MHYIYLIVYLCTTHTLCTQLFVVYMYFLCMFDSYQLAINDVHYKLPYNDIDMNLLLMMDDG